MDATTEMGPLVSEEQAERVAGFVDRARKDGGKVLTGGGRIKKAGSWYSPTVVVPSGPDAEIVKREVFGPVVTVQRFSDEEQAACRQKLRSPSLFKKTWDHYRSKIS